MSFSFETTTSLAIDVTSYCNSFCGECSRNVQGGENHPRLELHHMQPATWFKLATEDNLRNIKQIIFNGNYGDATMHPLLLEFLEHLAQVKDKMFVSIHTNGGARTPEFYKQLSKVLNKFALHNITFGVDGLEDTAPQYRRGVNFNNVISNAKSFIDAGGYAVWRYIVFDHNIDQVEQAAKLAKEYGFKEFKLNRSISKTIEMKLYKDFPAQTITAPEKNVVKDLSDRFNFQPDVQVDFIKSKSVCPWAQDNRVQIDMYGRIYPCCYFTLDIFGNMERKERLTDLWKFNSINKNKLQEILNNTYYTDILPKKWKDKEIIRCVSCQGYNKIE